MPANTVQPAHPDKLEEVLHLSVDFLHYHRLPHVVRSVLIPQVTESNQREKLFQFPATLQNFG